MTDIRPGSMRAAFRYRRFRALLSALAVSSAGDWLYNLALIALVYNHTHSSSWVGATTAARVLPIVLLGPIGGAVADRWDRRWTMIASDLLRAALMVLLAVAAATDAPVVLAPLLAAAATAASAVYPPCAAATVPRLVPDADLAGANAARTAVGQAGIVAGPAIGGLILLLGSPALAFLLNAVTFALSAAVVAAIPAGPHFSPSRTTGPTPRLVAELKAGAAALRQQPDALRVVGADIVCSFVYGTQTALLVLVAHRLGAGAQGYGYLLAGFGLGGVLATARADRAVNTRRPALTLALALLAVAAPIGLFVVAPSLTAAVGLAVISGAGSVLVEVCAETTLQRSLDDAVFARAYGLALPASLGGIVAGSLVAPACLSVVGLSATLIGLAVLVALYAGMLLRPQVTRDRKPAPATAG